MYEDALWVKQTLAGDEKAFHHLIRKYQSAIYGLILSHIGNPDDAQELAQDVFLKAYQNLSSLHQPEQFHAWLRRIARNRCCNWRLRTREPSAPLLVSIPVETPPVDEELVLRETIARVMQAVDELPRIEGQLLKERYLDDSSYADLQARHGLSYKAVTMRIHRARRKVRERVEKLFSGVVAFPWHKVLMGGVEAVKIGIKTKLAVIGISALLISGGILTWHYSQPPHAASDFEAAAKQSTGTSAVTPVLGKKGGSTVPDESDKSSQQEQGGEELTKEQAEEVLSWLDSLDAEGQTGGAAQSGDDSAEADKEKKAQDEAARLEHEREVEAAKQQVTETVIAKGEVLEWFRSCTGKEDPKLVERQQDASRDLGMRLLTIDIMNYFRLTKDFAATRRGGWIFELCIEHGFTIGDDPYEPYRRSPVFQGK